MPACSHPNIPVTLLLLGVGAAGTHTTIDAEMEDRAGQVLADEVAASSLAPAAPAPNSNRVGGGHG
jgi:hypothetical protein